jgi:replicative DNA helicase
MVKPTVNNPAGRIPPQSIQAEQAVLCSCLDSESAMTVALTVLVPADFYHPGHRLIFTAILELSALRNAVDIITVSEHLAKKGELEAVGGTAYISQLSDLMIIRSNVSDYAAIVRQKSMLRRLITSLDEVMKLSFEGEQEANNLVDIAIKRLSDMREAPTGAGFESVNEILKRTLQDILDISKGKKERKVVHTGFSKLDQATGGLRPGSLIIVAARPAMGKSALVVNIATNTAISYKTHVAFFSLEMSKEEIGNRILSSKSNVSTFKLQNANIADDEWTKISEALSLLTPAPFYIDDRSGINTVEMMAKCRQLKNENRLGLVVVDYMQLMTPAGGRNFGNRQQEISEISRSLKIMAKELEVPVIALSQLSRGAEQRDEHRPILSDLRDSGAIEQDADLVMFIYRKNYYESNLEKPEIEDAEIILAKNRQGPTKTVHMKWWAKRTMFFEPALPGEAEEDDNYTPGKKTGAKKESPDAIYNPGDKDAPPEFDPIEPG